MTLSFDCHRIRLGNTAFEGLNNCYVLGTEPDAELTLVDTGIGHPETLAELRAALAEVDATFADVDRVLLTHWHGDHAGLAGEIQAAAGCPVHVHEADAPLVERPSAGHADALLREHVTDWGMPDEKQAELFDFLAGADEWPAPTVTPFAAGDTFDIGPVTLEAVHLPGHTAGLSGFAFDGTAGRELFAGDALLPYYTPNVGGADVRVDAPLSKYLDTLAGIVRDGYVRAWPGHRGAIVDPPGRAADIIAHHRKRTARVVDVLDDGPASPWVVSAVLFGDLQNIHILHGPGEAFAHLDHLHDAGLVERSGREYALRSENPDIGPLFPDLQAYLPAGYEPVA
ncbi:MBL fold metallo-hydrolase [Halosegnis sp.]|uniref:MBL fold metallo-hydrolase n=1 Tax=Halosegnis sp. TaxID=2864959 RepID=UPI0035D4D448